MFKLALKFTLRNGQEKKSKVEIIVPILFTTFLQQLEAETEKESSNSMA
jgi:hypothetical protein